MQDNSYHIQYKNTDNIIICFDIDYVKSEKTFNSIINIITDYFDIEDDEISYTKSIKGENEFSYHISIPKYYIKCSEMKNIIDKLIYMYPLYSQYFDNSIYKTTNIFRLPYQTNKQKPYIHTVIKGYSIDFIFNHIGFFSKNYYESEIYKYNLENTHITDTNNKIEIKEKNIIENIEILNINKTEIKLFHLLDITRIDNYNEWIKIGCLI